MIKFDYNVIIKPELIKLQCRRRSSSSSNSGSNSNCSSNSISSNNRKKKMVDTKGENSSLL